MRNVLVVTTVSADEGRLREALGPLDDGASVRIVAPAAHLSFLDWLTNDEDRARTEAEDAAERTASALDGSANVRVDRTSINSDVAANVGDALRTSQVDEVVVVTRPGEDAAWLEEDAVRAALEEAQVPVRRVELPAT